MQPLIPAARTTFEIISIVGDGLTLLLYLALAVVAATLITLRNASVQVMALARVSATAFFIGCAGTHTEMIFHALPSPTAMAYDSLHHALGVTMQVGGAGTFLILATISGGFYFSKSGFIR